MKIFIPIDDKMLDTPDFQEILVPYQPGVPTINQMKTAVRKSGQSRSSSSGSPGLTASSAALPALSSSTYLAGPALE